MTNSYMEDLENQITPTARPIIFGEVLFDCFSNGEEVLGGAPLNVAWNLKAFGFDPLLISRVGEDERGERVLATMKSWGLRTDGVQLDSERPTGAVAIEQVGENHRFAILDQQAYDFISYPEVESLLKSLKSDIPMVYHGSLAVRHETSRCTLEALRKNFETSFFVDINLREPWWEPSSVFSLMAGVKWLKLSDEELRELVDSPETPLDEIAQQFKIEYRLDTLILTQGKDGATILAGERIFSKQAPERKESVVDTVGAGDAFSSVVMAGILRGWSMQCTLDRALSFASRVVRIRGATSDDRALYVSERKKWID